MIKKLLLLATVASVTSCTSLSREVSRLTATSFGADYIVVKRDMLGKPFLCWKLKNVTVTSERTSDGIYWQHPTGHLIHISGNYDYVQVKHGDYDSAMSLIKLTKTQKDMCS